MYILPLTAKAPAEFILNTATASFRFNVYFVSGVMPTWAADIYSADGTPLIVGMPLVAGTPNNFTGLADTLRGYTLLMLDTEESTADRPDAAGNTLNALFYLPGEDSFIHIPDPLIAYVTSV